MPFAITMPRLSDTMEQGKIIKWSVKVGDKVAAGQEIADVETDKATMPVQAFEDGVVVSLAQAGQEIKVGQLIVLLAAKGETAEQAQAAYQASAGAAPAAKAPASGGKPAPSPAPAPIAATVKPIGAGAAPAPAKPAAAPAAVVNEGRIKASPLAKKVAAEAKVDLAYVPGTGPGGRVVRADVLTAIEKGVGKPAPAAKPAKKADEGRGYALPPVQPLEARVIEITSKRRTIARRLVESKQQAPHFTVTMAIDVDPLLALRKQINNVMADQGVKLSVNDFVVRAVALGLCRHPIVNSSWSEQGIVLHGTANIGVAVSLPLAKGGGLVVPTIRDAHLKSVSQISEDTRRLATKARGEGLSIDEQSDGTFTVSNLGMFGVEHFEAILNPPQAAILAVGAALEKAVVRNGQIVVGNEMSLTLSCDHRALDGAVGAEYLQTLKYLLENPAALLV